MREDEFKTIEEGSPLPKLDLRLAPHAEQWGDYFLHTEGNTKRNYYVLKVCESARYAVPMVRHIVNMIDE